MAQTKLQQAIAAKIAAKQKAQNEVLDTLANNEAYVAVQADVAVMASDIQKLDTVIAQLNTGITPFIAKDGSKYSVRVFPVAAFGPVLGKVVGIIQGSSSAFTDEMAMEYETILGHGISHIELSMASEAVGKASYLNKDGIIVDAQYGDSELAYNLIVSIANKLELLSLSELSHIDVENKIVAWHRAARSKANKVLKEQQLAAQLDTDEFTLED